MALPGRGRDAVIATLPHGSAPPVELEQAA
jgi:hypothetical protein